MILRLSAALSALLLLAACQNLPTPSAEGESPAPGAETVTLSSAQAVDFSDILQNNGPSRQIEAELYVPPEARKPVPAVIIASGGEGVGERERMYAGELVRSGIAALIPASFDGSGDQAESLPYATQLRDLIAGYQFLAQDERFDARRVGVLGFSRGGTAAYLAAHKPFLSAVAGDGAAFAAHLPAYPFCTWQIEEFEAAEVPVFFIWGGKDQWAPSEICLPVVNALTAAGNAIASKTYTSAYHAFDLAPIAIRDNPEARRLVGCRNAISPAGETVLTGRDVTEGSVALDQDFAAYQEAAFRQCGETGARTGAELDWRGNLARDVLNFFEQSLKPDGVVF